MTLPRRLARCAPRLTFNAISRCCDLIRRRSERGRGMDSNDWMAAKLVGLFGLIVAALVAVYFFTVFG